MLAGTFLYLWSLVQNINLSTLVVIVVVDKKLSVIQGSLIKNQTTIFSRVPFIFLHSKAMQRNEMVTKILSFKFKKTKLKFSPSSNLHVAHYRWWNKLLFVLYVLWIPNMNAGIQGLATLSSVIKQLENKKVGKKKKKKGISFGSLYGVLNIGHSHLLLFSWIQYYKMYLKVLLEFRCNVTLIKVTQTNSTWVLKLPDTKCD